ncbi:MAG: ABC transporter substrate-binding protein [bacterium]
MKRLFVVLLFTLAALSLVFATGQQEGGDQRMEEQELTFWTMSLAPAFDDYLNGVIEEFEAQYPNVTVEWVDVPWGDMETKILTAAASDTMPDVANLNLPFSQKLAQNGRLVDMSDEAADVRARYFDGPWEASSYEDTIFGLPWYITTNMIYYNRAIFEEAGLNPDDPPSNFEELYDYAAAIKENTGSYGYMTFFNDQFIMEELERMGIRLFNDDFTEAQFNTRAVRDAADYYRQLLDEGLIPRETLTSKSGTGEAVQLYSSGELAMFFGGTSHARMISENSEQVYDNTGVAPQIVDENGKRNIAVMNVVVPKDSPHKDAAVEFAKFLTDNENQVEFAREAGAIVPSTAASLEDPFFSEHDGTPATAARIMSAQEVATGSVIFPPIQNWPDIRDAFINAFQKAVAGEGNPSDLLGEAEDRANELLSE